MKIIEEIAIGLATTAIGAILVRLWDQVVHPGLIQLFVEKTKLSEEFRGDIDFGKSGTDTVSLRIKKFGYGISGSLRFTSGPNTGQTYRVTGRYSQGFLTFTYEPDSPTSTSQGSGTFKRMQDGEQLKGSFAYNRKTTDVISTVECTLVRA